MSTIDDSPVAGPLRSFLDFARNHPDAIAIIIGDEAWTYSRLSSEVLKLARGLRKAGIVKGDRIVTLAKTSPNAAIFMLASVLAGAIIVPLKKELTVVELGEFFHRLSPSLIFHDIDMGPSIASAGAGLPCRIVTSANEGDISWRSLSVEQTSDVFSTDLEAVCLLLATSGTTGVPKLVTYNQRAIHHLVESMEQWETGPGMRLMANSPIAHVSGTMILFVGLSTGCTLVMPEGPTIDHVLDAVEQHGVQAMFVVPFICPVMVDAQLRNPRNVSSLRICGIGGDACRSEVALDFQRAFDVRLRNTYGMTECLGSMDLGDTWDVMRPRPDRIRLVGPDGNTVTRGVIGEVHMRGPNTSLGYWEAPGVVRTHLTGDGWLATGDQMREDEDGMLHFVSRSKDMILREGFNISPTAVENRLLQHALVADVAVVGMPDDRRGQLVVAAIKLAPDAREDGLASVMTWLNTQLGAFHLPDRLHTIDRIPRNAMGKVLRHEVAGALLKTI